MLGIKIELKKLLYSPYYWLILLGIICLGVQPLLQVKENQQKIANRMLEEVQLISVDFQLSDELEDDVIMDTYHQLQDELLNYQKAIEEHRFDSIPQKGERLYAAILEFAQNNPRRVSLSLESQQTIKKYLKVYTWDLERGLPYIPVDGWSIGNFIIDTISKLVHPIYLGVFVIFLLLLALQDREYRVRIIDRTAPKKWRKINFTRVLVRIVGVLGGALVALGLLYSMSLWRYPTLLLYWDLPVVYQQEQAILPLWQVGVLAVSLLVLCWLVLGLGISFLSRLFHSNLRFLSMLLLLIIMVSWWLQLNPTVLLWDFVQKFKEYSGEELLRLFLLMLSIAGGLFLLVALIDFISQDPCVQLPTMTLSRVMIHSCLQAEWLKYRRAGFYIKEGQFFIMSICCFVGIVSFTHFQGKMQAQERRLSEVAIAKKTLSASSMEKFLEEMLQEYEQTNDDSFLRVMELTKQNIDNIEVEKQWYTDYAKQSLWDNQEITSLYIQKLTQEKQMLQQEEIVFGNGDISAYRTIANLRKHQLRNQLSLFYMNYLFSNHVNYVRRGYYQVLPQAEKMLGNSEFMVNETKDSKQWNVSLDSSGVGGLRFFFENGYWIYFLLLIIYIGSNGVANEKEKQLNWRILQTSPYSINKVILCKYAVSLLISLSYTLMLLSLIFGVFALVNGVGEWHDGILFIGKLTTNMLSVSLNHHLVEISIVSVGSYIFWGSLSFIGLVILNISVIHIVQLVLPNKNFSYLLSLLMSVFPLLYWIYS